MKKNYLDITSIRRYLIFCGVLLAGILAMFKCHAFGTGFHPPEHVEFDLPNHDMDNMKKEAEEKIEQKVYTKIEKKEKEGRASKKERKKKDEIDAKRIKNASHYESKNI